MKNSDPLGMTDVLSALYRENSQIKNHMISHTISLWWEKTYPKYAPYTQEIKYDGSYMTIKLTSDALRHTLSMSRDKLLSSINGYLGGDIVEHLCFL